MQELNGQKRRIIISHTPFASGGEGSVYNIPEHPDLVAKIFTNDAKRGYYAKKVSYMIEHPPFQGTANESIKNILIWPQTRLEKNGMFLGYSMQKLQESVTLKNLTVLNSPLLQQPLWEKYHRGRPGNFLNRLIICYNLAIALKLLHQNGKYTMVDLKPENLMITPKGKFSVVDIDGVQITENEKVIFNAQAYTEDYAPPEMIKINYKTERIPAEWDYFCYAIIVYEILLGIHPFQGMPKKGAPSLRSNITRGLFANGSRKKQLRTVPAQHGNFRKLPAPVRRLLLRTLNKGAFKISSRASFKEWKEVLTAQIHDERNNIIIPNHLGVRTQFWNIKAVKFSLPNLTNYKPWKHAGITGFFSQIEDTVRKFYLRVHFSIGIIPAGGMAFIQTIVNNFKPGYIRISYFYCHTSINTGNEVKVFLSDIFILPDRNNELSKVETIFSNALSTEYPNNHYRIKQINTGKHSSYSSAKKGYYSVFNTYLSKKNKMNFVSTRHFTLT